MAYEIVYRPKQYVIEYSQKRGPRGADGADGSAEPLPANTAPGNFTEVTALATNNDKNQWLVWLDVPSNFAFGTLSSTVIGLAGDLVTLETEVANKVDDTDSRLSNAREWTASTVTQPEAEAGTATTRRAWTAQRIRQAITNWWANVALPSIGAALGKIYDGAENATVLECADSEWIFSNTTVRDNLRVALNAVGTFNVDSNILVLESPEPSAFFYYASFYFQSYSGPLGDDFGTVVINANAEEGFTVSYDYGNTGKAGALQLFAGGVSIGFDINQFQILEDSYVVGKPSRLREAISAVEDFETSITGEQSFFRATRPASSDVFGSLFVRYHSGPLGDNFGSTWITCNPEEGMAIGAKANGVSPVFEIKCLPVVGYAVEQPANFRAAINTPSRDEALYYAIALGGI